MKDLRASALRAADLLEDIFEALSGRGTLEARSLHLGANKFYRTLARDFAKDIREAAGEGPPVSDDKS